MIDANSSSRVDVVVVDGEVCSSPKVRNAKKKSVHIMDSFAEVIKVTEFACKTNMSLDWLKSKAKELKLIITMTGRSRQKHDRIGFGLRKKVLRSIQNSNKDFKITSSTLFKFGIQANGLFKPSVDNKSNVAVYKICKSKYAEGLNLEDVLDRENNERKRAKEWTEDDVNQLVEARCATNPPSFRMIALSLNQSNHRLGTPMDRPFNENDCRNKWHNLFPSSQDCNKAVEYVRELRKIWPALRIKTQSEKATDVEGPPKLTALHLVWPWSKSILSTLSSSIFCDATFKVTVYHYKVVMITTLDGNKSHRPLMTSFITHSSGAQWSVIFDLFRASTVVEAHDMYVVTSDQEESISCGLNMSQLKDMNVHYLCSLHMKWNVASHKLVFFEYRQ